MYSLFSGAISRHYTKVRYHAGYKDEDGDNIDEIIFQGLINGKTISDDFETGKITIIVLAYEQILTERTIACESLRNNLTGELEVTKDSFSIIGMGTLFTSELSAGDTIYIINSEGEASRYFVDAIQDNTHLTLKEKYVGDSAGSNEDGLSYFNSKKTASVIIGNIFDNDSSITDFITYSSGNINPGTNITFDDATKYETKKVSEVLNDIAKKTSSVWYIDSDLKVIFRSRTINANTPFEFIGGNRQSRDVNILNIDFYDDGFTKIINQVNYSTLDQTYLTNSLVADNLERFGTNKLDLEGEMLTTESVILSLNANIIAANEFPKKRVIVSTVYLPNVNEFLDKVTVSYKSKVKDFNRNLLIFNDRITDFNDNYFDGKYENRNIILDSINFKYYGAEHDVKNGVSKHHLIEN
jgi:hypothetical protein